MPRNDAPILILASASPRRRELLTRAGLTFRVCAPDVDEAREAGESAAAMVERLAVEKARDVMRRAASDSRNVVLAADTLVVIDDDILGKPRDAADALSFLRRLAGREHRVLTGIAVAASDTANIASRVVETRVSMRSVEDADLRAYVQSGESLDKAGGYAIQGGARRFIESVRGSESNVIGLPIEETLSLLREAGLGGDAA